MNSTKRKRARLACKPCRERKRRCDGENPCNTCRDWGYACAYETPSRRRDTSRSLPRASPESPSARPLPGRFRPPAAPTGVAESAPDHDHHDGLARHMEANSGAAFVRKLGLKMDPNNAPRLNLFGWNTGARQLSSEVALPATLSLVEVASLEHIRALARVYFDKLDPCYGFIDQQQFFDRLDWRWSPSATPTVYDSVLAGVAAIGCVFSQRTATITEIHLVHLARTTLDGHNLVGPPSIDLLTGWTLRTVYLRLTDSPHSTWIASSTVMHLIEASGLHPESSLSVLLPSAQRSSDIGRRLVGVAHHLNIWTSFELGLSRVGFQTDEMPLLPASKPGDCTLELLELLPVSASLDPGRVKTETDLKSTLSKILDRTHTQNPSVMAQCNLTLCILRHIHSQNLEIAGSLAERVLVMLKKALECARNMVIECCPWHQVANVPFQIVCVLLVMDTRSSLAMLPEAMQTINMVATAYPTDTMREAYSTACLLVMLHQQRRRYDLSVFGDVLNEHQQAEQALSELQPQVGPSTQENLWLEALVADFPGLQGVDFDQFLQTDMVGALPVQDASEAPGLPQN